MTPNKKDIIVVLILAAILFYLTWEIFIGLGKGILGLAVGRIIE